MSSSRSAPWAGADSGVDDRRRHSSPRVGVLRRVPYRPGSNRRPRATQGRADHGGRLKLQRRHDQRRSKAGEKQAGGAVGIVSATYHFHPTSSSRRPDLLRARRADDPLLCTGSELHHALFSSAYPGVHHFSDSHFDLGLLWRGVSRHSQDCERTGTSCRPWAGLAPRGWPSAHCARPAPSLPSSLSDVDPTFGTCYRTRRRSECARVPHQARSSILSMSTQAV